MLHVGLLGPLRWTSAEIRRWTWPAEWMWMNQPYDTMATIVFFFYLFNGFDIWHRSGNRAPENITVHILLSRINIHSYSGVSPGQTNLASHARTISAEKLSTACHYQLSALGFWFWILSRVEKTHQKHQHLTRAAKKHQARFIFCQSKSNLLISTAKSDAVQFVRCPESYCSLQLLARYCSLFKDIWKLCRSLFTMFHQSINHTRLNEIQRKLDPRKLVCHD